jgi:hypothetical protein
MAGADLSELKGKQITNRWCIQYTPLLIRVIIRSDITIKMAAPRGLHLFVTYCCRQDGGGKCSVYVKYSTF